jgi:hypothetical protein
MKVIKPLDVNSKCSLSRSSSATYYDLYGNLVLAGVDQLRYDFDPVTKEFRGALIEPTRTNLFLNTASSLDPPVTIALVTQTVSLSRDSDYTISFRGSGEVVIGGLGLSTGDPVVSNVGSGIKEFTFKTPSGSGNVSITFTVTGSLTHAQVELGSFRTSWIPTTGSPQIRSADNISGSGILYSDFQDSTPVWDAGITYTKGFRAQSSFGIYESQVANNLNNPPETSPIDKWIYIQPTNDFAMFDRSKGVSSVHPSTIAILTVVLPEGANSAAIMSTTADAFHVAITSQSMKPITSSALPVWGSTSILRGNCVYTQAVQGSVVSFFITNSTNSIEVGELLVGNTFTMGKTQYGFKVSVVDYSKKETDSFGNTNFIKGKFSIRASASVMVDNTAYNGTIETARELIGSPAVWIASEDPSFQAGAIVYGFYKGFDVEIPYPTMSLCSLEIEGLT